MHMALTGNHLRDGGRRDDGRRRAQGCSLRQVQGRLIEEVLDDPQFASWTQWALNQPGIRANYPTFCQIIINRGAAPEETPDHNAMQVKFLDDEFCRRFLQHIEPDYGAQAGRNFNEAREANLRRVVERMDDKRERLEDRQAELPKVADTIPEYHRNRSSDERAQYVAERRKSLEEEIRERRKELLLLALLRKSLGVPIQQIDFRCAREFEVSGVDVALEISAHSDQQVEAPPEWTKGYYDPGWKYGYWRVRFKIELKPTIGDDYPAVLRQMKRTGADVLFVGDYTGQGATEQQFVKTMGIRSASSEGMRPSSPSPQRYSTVMSRPSTKSDSANPRRKPAITWTYAPGEAIWRNPITGIAGCCARTASGHAAAAPPRAKMNWRRLLIRSPRRRAAGTPLGS
jgi:hypothetical protein